jgi:hypothetical protein
MNTTYWLVLILALFLSIYTGAQAIPLLVLMFAPRWLKFWFIDPAESQRRINASTSAQEKISQLRELGFLVLGIKGERILWQPPVYEVALSNPQKEAYASIILDSNNDQALGTYFYTAMSGGGIVFTRARSRMLELEIPGTSVKNISDGDLNAMLSSHSQRLRAFKQRGISALPVQDQAARIEATYRYYESAYIKKGRRNLPRLLPAINFVLAVVLLIAVVVTAILRLAPK